MDKRGRYSFCIGLLIIAGLVYGKEPSTFPVPSFYKPYVQFWIDVFARYHGNEIIFHDAEKPWKILKIFRFEELDPLNYADKRLYKDVIKEKRKELEKILSELDSDPYDSAKKSEVHSWIYYLYKDELKNDPEVFRKLKDRLRAQWGLREKTMQSFRNFAFYRPHIERILRQYNMPNELKFLPIVESGYQPFSASFAGAKGMWQFMRSAAKKHGLVVGRYVDQRYDPIYSTYAALRYLKQSYEEFQSWPLALTSYNHGKVGIRKAIKQTGTRDWKTIFHEYESRSFRFASKNFYAEFLAVKEIGTHVGRYFPDLEEELESIQPWQFAEYQLPRTYHLRDIPRKLGIPLSLFFLYNPQFTLRAYLKNVRIRKRTVIRIPLEEEKEYAYHIVRPGETLRMIARVYGLSLQRIRKLNPDIPDRRLIPGTKLVLSEQSRTQIHGVSGSR